MRLEEYANRLNPWDIYPIASTFYSGPMRILVAAVQGVAGAVLTTITLSVGWLDAADVWWENIVIHTKGIAQGIGNLVRGIVALVPFGGNLLIYLYDNSSSKPSPSTETIGKMRQQDMTAVLQSEFNALKKSEDPKPDVAIEAVLVLSAVATYFGKVPESVTYEVDPLDDYNRVQQGIRVARSVAALHRNNEEDLDNETLIQYGPVIVYNGRPDQNKALKEALDRGIITNYPVEKFAIYDLDPKEVNTKGQFISFQKDLHLNPNSHVAIVSHAYHWPRTSRMIERYPLGRNVKVHAFLVDREFKSPGVKEAEKREIGKIPEYIARGDLTQQPAKGVFYSAESTLV